MMKPLFGALLVGCAAGLSCLGGCATKRDIVSVERVPETAQEAEAADRLRFRPHHYLFAHRMLPQVFYGSTELLLLHLRGEGVGELERLWGQIAERLEPKDRLPAGGFALEITTHESDVRVFWITLPPPERSPEAHYVALALRGPRRTYYTLEKSVPIGDDEVTTAFCAWTREGAHQNFGQAGQPSLAHFKKLVLDAELAGPPPVEASFRPGR